MATGYFDRYRSLSNAGSPPSPLETPLDVGFSSRRKTPSSRNVSPLGEQDQQQQTKNISPLDPKRLTPTLHASLISEILNLRRELESKDAFIDNLETNLQNSRTEHEALNERLATSVKDIRRIQKESDDAQAHLYEVCEGLAKERDDAIIKTKDFGDKHDLLARKNRRQEDDFAKWQRDWEEEKNRWDNERRQLERRVHVTENRLRTVVDEFSAQQNVSRSPDLGQDNVSTQADDAFKDSGFGNESEAGSIRSFIMHNHHRTRSSISLRSNPQSLRSPSKRRSGKPQGLSLADELDIEEEENHDYDDYDQEESHVIVPRPADRDAKARRILGFGSEADDTKVGSERREVTDRGDGAISPRMKRRDISGSSPEISRWAIDDRRDSKAATKLIDLDMQNSPRTAFDQSRDTTTSVSVPSDSQANGLGISQISSNAAQAPLRSVYQSAETQTYTIDSATAESMPQLYIPSISIHPPQSRPSSPGASVLPPGTRNAECQTENTKIETKDSGVQTESFDMYKWASGEIAQKARSASVTSEFAFGEESGSRKNFRSLRLKAIPLPKPVLASTDRTGQPQNTLPQADTQEVQSTSMPFPERDAMDSEEGFAPGDTRSTRVEDVFAASSTSPRWNSQFQSPSLPMTVPEDSEISPHRDWNESTERSLRQPFEPKSRFSTKDWRMRSAHSKLASATRSEHSRTPSGETMASSVVSTSSQPPPLPIPKRSSSRTHSDVLSEAASTPSRDSGSPTSRRHERYPSVRKRPVPLRKVQSASTMRTSSKFSPPKRRRQAPPLTPIRSSVIIESPGPTHFPLPENVTSVSSSWEPRPGNPAESVSGDAQDVADPDNPLNDPTLVDAVASSMVGDWMYKYVQKRKSFGVSDSSAQFGSDTARHKRWIWLSPYERTIMWSNKQPISGAALMGKNGRKLTVKTVLDVKDDNPMPKGESSATIFDRSIVVLTPSRALKLTAPNRERHYLWLMALSFLADPSQTPPQVPRVPEEKKQNGKSKDASTSTRFYALEKHMDKSQGRNFSEPTKPSYYQHSKSKTTPIYDSMQSSQDLQPEMRPLESFARHSRKRSNTGPLRTSSSITGLKSFSSFVSPTSPTMSFPRSRRNTVTKSPSVPPRSRQTSITSPLSSDFTDPNSGELGTIRMEAFVDNSYRDGVLYVPALPPQVRPRPRSRQGSAVSVASRQGVVFDDTGDLFRGF